MGRKRAEHSHLVTNLRVDSYSSHVLDKLVGIKGRDRTDVAVFIIRSWIAEHQQEIAGYGITVTVKNGALGLE